MTERQKKLEAILVESQESKLVRGLCERLNLDPTEALALYYSSDLSRYIEEGRYGIQYLDAQVLLDELLSELENRPAEASSVG